jgi:hypothetical protein
VLKHFDFIIGQQNPHSFYPFKSRLKVPSPILHYQAVLHLADWKLSKSHQNLLGRIENGLANLGCFRRELNGVTFVVHPVPSPLLCVPGTGDALACILLLHCCVLFEIVIRVGRLGAVAVVL